MASNAYRSPTAVDLDGVTQEGNLMVLIDTSAILVSAIVFAVAALLCVAGVAVLVGDKRRADRTSSSRPVATPQELPVRTGHQSEQDLASEERQAA